MEGNERFTNDKLTHLGQSLNVLRQHTVEKQEPFATVLSCVDSRVPVELVFDQTIGQLLVARVAGNILTPEIVGSLEFGAALLGHKVILVLGHSSCGAVTAAMKGDPVPGLIGSFFPHIQPAVERAWRKPRQSREGKRQNAGGLAGEIISAARGRWSRKAS